MCAKIISNVIKLESLGADEGRGENKEGSVMVREKKRGPRESLVGRVLS